MYELFLSEKEKEIVYEKTTFPAAGRGHGSNHADRLRKPKLPYRGCFRRKTTTRYAGEAEKVQLVRRKKEPPVIEWQQVRQPLQTKSMEVIQMDNNSFAHTKWNCKYHIVFTPKYRRQIIAF